MKPAIKLGAKSRKIKKIIEITDWVDSSQLIKLNFLKFMEAHSRSIMKEAMKSSRKFPASKSCILFSTNYFPLFHF